MAYFLSYLVTGCISLFLNFSHPLHVSLTSIEYSKDKANFEIAIKLNTEDFEFAIAHNYEIILNLNKKNELKEANKYINNYFVNAFQLFINEKDKLKLTLAHKETEEESTWLYFSAAYNGIIKKISIKNAILLDVFMDQTNMVILSNDGKETGYKLDFYKRDINFNINNLSNKSE